MVAYSISTHYFNTARLPSSSLHYKPRAACSCTLPLASHLSYKLPFFQALEPTCLVSSRTHLHCKKKRGAQSNSVVRRGEEHLCLCVCARTYELACTLLSLIAFPSSKYTPMAPTLFSLCLFISFCGMVSSRPLPDPLVNETSNPNYNLQGQKPSPIAQASPNHLQQSANMSRRELGYYTTSCETGNPIDDCWRCDSNWESNRKKLADCAIGFGRDAIGGRDGEFYVVTDPSDDDPVTPKPGTLRHAVIQSEPLWIIFDSDMNIVLKEELLMNSYKTIDGRGHEVHVSHGPCITLQDITNVIIHGIHVHDCKPAGNAMVRDSPTHYGYRTISDGDGISLFGARDVWVDHVSFARCTDGLFDAIMGSTAITVSNSFFTQHDKVMLLSHSDDYMADKTMQATIAFNHFGEGLVQRMPRCRHGYFEIVNNDYTHWEMYAIGGSAAPTINSKGNRYTAPFDPYAKDVTMRMDTPENQWQTWEWRSEGDLFINGAFFIPSGAGASSNYGKAASIGPKSSALVGTMTANAGALACRAGSAC